VTTSTRQPPTANVDQLPSAACWPQIPRCWRWRCEQRPQARYHRGAAAAASGRSAVSSSLSEAHSGGRGGRALQGSTTRARSFGSSSSRSACCCLAPDHLRCRTAASCSGFSSSPVRNIHRSPRRTCCSLRPAFLPLQEKGAAAAACIHLPPLPTAAAGGPAAAAPSAASAAAPGCSCCLTVSWQKTCLPTSTSECSRARLLLLLLLLLLSARRVPAGDDVIPPAMLPGDLPRMPPPSRKLPASLFTRSRQVQLRGHCLCPVQQTLDIFQRGTPPAARAASRTLPFKLSLAICWGSSS